MPYYCPRHKVEMEKNHLDNYYCPECDHDWLIHPYKSERRGEKRERKPRAKPEK